MAMDLILWRHADAAEGHPDEARRLTAKGIRQAEKVAAWLAARLTSEYRVLSSPALRARETAAALSANPVIEPAISTAATPQGLLRAAGWPRGTGIVVLVGHQPTLGAAAALALTGKPLPWSLKKGALWWIARAEDDGLLVRAVISPGVL